MQKFVLSTDTSCDVYKSELDSAGIPWVPLTYSIGEKTFEDNFSKDSEYIDFYAQIKKGVMPLTSQINVFAHEEFFNSVLSKNDIKIIVHLPLSSGLSNTYNSACIAAENVMRANPGSKILVVDTIAATQGHHYLLDEAIEMRDKGLEAQEVFDKLTSITANLHHWILVDDLFHLKRGGRVSGPSAYIGSLLKIKPILVVNNVGKLAVVKKVKGLAKAYQYFIDMINEHAEDTSNLKIYFASADAQDKLEEFTQILKENFPTVRIKSGWIGPIIGAHTGAGTCGIVFKTKTGRLENKSGE